MYAKNTVETWEMTVEVDDRDTFAETAITGFGNEGESPFGYFGITRIVSDSGTETFLGAGSFGAPSYRQAVYRTGVTSVRVQLASWRRVDVTGLSRAERFPLRSERGLSRG